MCKGVKSAKHIKRCKIAFSMLISNEHENDHAHNVKMPRTVGVLTIIPGSIEKLRVFSKICS